MISSNMMSSHLLTTPTKSLSLFTVLSASSIFTYFEHRITDVHLTCHLFHPSVILSNNFRLFYSLRFRHIASYQAYSKIK